MCFHNASEQTCLQGFASAVFKHKAALRKQSGAAQAAGKNILFACLSMLLYHRNAPFTMNSARTKPQQYPIKTQLNLYNPETFPPHLSASGVWESFCAVSKARRDFEYSNKSVFQKSLRALCGQTFDTPFPLSLFFSAERYGRLKIIRELYRLCFLRPPVYRDIHRKCCRFRAWFSLPL